MNILELFKHFLVLLLFFFFKKKKLFALSPTTLNPLKCKRKNKEKIYIYNDLKKKDYILIWNILKLYYKL